MRSAERTGHNVLVEGYFNLNWYSDDNWESEPFTDLQRFFL